MMIFTHFFSYFRVEKRLESFYKLLVKESLDREDVEAMEKENIKDCHEILQMFRDSKGVLKYFVTRAVIQLTVGVLLCVLLIWIFNYHLMGSELKCEALGLHHTCIVPLANFYYAILTGALVSAHGFVACCIYKLTWILFTERMSPFAKLMRNKRKHIDRCIENETSNKDLKPLFTHILPCISTAEPFFDVYHNPKSPDFGLLVTMLATRNGVAEGLRILSMFDNDYQKLWKPATVGIFHGTIANKYEDKIIECGNLNNVSKPENDSQEEMNAVTIVWTDAPIAPFIDGYNHKCNYAKLRKRSFKTQKMCENYCKISYSKNYSSYILNLDRMH